MSINNNNDNVINEPFTTIELNKAIDMSKCTTPGKHEISNDIKHFSIKTPDYLLIIFNLIWFSAQCPSSWKEAIIIPIPKPGKNTSDPLLYRPIALTYTLCKLMVNIRLIISKITTF